MRLVSVQLHTSGTKRLRRRMDGLRDIVDDVKEMVDDGLLEPVLGKKTYTDNETGKDLQESLRRHTRFGFALWFRYQHRHSHEPVQMTLKNGSFKSMKLA